MLRLNLMNMTFTGIKLPHIGYKFAFLSSATIAELIPYYAKSSYSYIKKKQTK